MTALADMIADIRIEIQAPTTTLFTDSELTRGIQKTVNLMSRLLPKRLVIEATLARTITAETLVIASSTGTLAYKPIKKGSLTITGKIENTDYKVNYLTGVVTEIGALLTDGSYSATYELDPSIIDLTSILTDYIKIERVEYPVGNNPPSLLTFDIYGNFLVLRGTGTLTTGDKVRITYLAKWTPPGTSVGDYPTHLYDAVVIGAAGQSLIYKAEYYVLQASTALATLTPPVAYTFVKAATPSIPAAPTAPTAPTISFTAAEAAMTAISTEITAAKAHITSGIALVNVAPRGEAPAVTYARYAEAVFAGANTRVNEALAQLREIEETLTKYASQVTSYGSDVNAYANNISGLTTIQRNQNDIEAGAVSNFAAQVNKYAAQIQEEDMKVRQFLDIAGRYLASGQAKINEFLAMLGVKAEFNFNKASSEQRS